MREDWKLTEQIEREKRETAQRNSWGERIGDWMQTYSGVQFFPLDPRAEDIRIEDIAHALSNQCRFAGHCNEFYSVAQHSVLVSELVEREAFAKTFVMRDASRLALWALLHDAPEAYLVDLPRPVKHCSTIGTEYRQVEARLMAVICEWACLPYQEPSEVKAADDRLLMTEKRDLLGPSPVPWRESASPLQQTISPWNSGYATRAFLFNYERLRGLI